MTYFSDARRDEGASLKTILSDQVDQIDALTAQAAGLLAERAEKTAEVLRANVQKILSNADNVDEARLTQELAVMAVKSDVTEELVYDAQPSW